MLKLFQLRIALSVSCRMSIESVVEVTVARPEVTKLAAAGAARARDARNRQFRAADAVPAARSVSVEPSRPSIFLFFIHYNAQRT